MECFKTQKSLIGTGVSYRTRRRKMVQARDPLHDVAASGAGSSLVKGALN